MNLDVLLCGNDADLLHLRGKVLSSAGFHVVSALGLSGLQRCHSLLTPALVIFCHAMPLEQQLEGSRYVREIWPGVKMMQMVTTGGPVSPESHLFQTFEGPAKLVEVTKSLTGMTQQAMASQ